MPAKKAQQKNTPKAQKPVAKKEAPKKEVPKKEAPKKEAPKKESTRKNITAEQMKKLRRSARKMSKKLRQIKSLELQKRWGKVLNANEEAKLPKVAEFKKKLNEIRSEMNHSQVKKA